MKRGHYDIADLMSIMDNVMGFLNLGQGCDASIPRDTRKPTAGFKRSLLISNTA